MARIHIIVIAGILLQCFITVSSFSQQADTTFVSLSKKKSGDRYTRAIEYQSRLYNGHDYIFYIAKLEEHPYFAVDDWTFGPVIYWGELYENVPLLYDLSTDQLVTENRSGATIRLIAEKVESFKLGDHTFVRLVADSANKISEGFYEQLYAGHLKVYAKHAKTYKEEFTNKEVIPSFDEHTRFYLVKDGIYYSVKSRAAALKILVDRKPEIKNFIRKNNISFKDRGAALVRISMYYDSLKE